MQLVKKNLAILLSICLGLIFIYSGYTKLLPVIETFEFTFVDIGIANWYIAPIIARLLIGLEFFLGILLILNYNLKKITLPFTIGLLFFFITYLIFQLSTSGNQSNCGCFGEHLRMTPVQAIIKNIVMILVCIIIYVLFDGWKTQYNKLLLSFLIVTSNILPFVFNPIDYAYTSNNLDEKVNYPLELNLLFNPEDTSKVETPKVDIRNGKQVIAFMSLSCPHCRIAAKKFKLIKKENPSLPISFILNGEKNKYKEFIEDTKATNIPYSFCLGKTFVNLAGTTLPRIYYLENSIIVKKVDYYELNQYQIEKWINTGVLN